MSDLTQAHVLQAAQIVALDDDALADRIAGLVAATQDPEFGDDNLTGAGWLELHALLDEQAKRQEAICPCCRNPGTRVAPGAICGACAAFPLD